MQVRVSGLHLFLIIGKRTQISQIYDENGLNMIKI